MAKAEYRSAIRSRRLINAALADLLMEKPLDKITVTDVVARAQINRGTFYAHFVDVPDVVNHWIQNAFADIRQVFTEQSGAAVMPVLLLQRIQQLLEQDLDFYKKIINSGAGSMLRETLTDIVLEYMLQHEQDYAFGSHEEYVLCIRFCAGGLSNLYRDWFAGKLPLSLDELTTRAATLLEGALSSIRTA